MITEDYILRMIHDMGRMLARLLGLRSDNPYAPQTYMAAGSGDGAQLLERLRELADQGEINRAEDTLFEELDFSNPQEFATALAFYEYINSFSDPRLELCGYSREEIWEGLRDCAAEFGVDKALLDLGMLTP